MPGYNHRANCSCGWCDGSGGGGGGGGNSAVHTLRVASEMSLTHPNSRCPVCRARVFFYRSPTGGGVYFDEMGPPWPKHPCMDSSGSEQHAPRAEAAPSTKRIVSQWQREDWTPLRFSKMSSGRSLAMGRRPGDWWVLEATEVLTGHRASFLLSDQPDLLPRGYFYVTPWNDYGIATMSWISFANGVQPAELEIRRPTRFGDLTADEVKRYELLPEADVLGIAVREAIAAGFRVEFRVPLDGDFELPAGAVERLASKIERAVEELGRAGWQEDRSDIERIELRVRHALQWAIPRPIGYDQVMRVLRAFA